VHRTPTLDQAQGRWCAVHTLLVLCAEPAVISDDELIEQADKGNLEAFEALYHRHRDWVYRLAWRFTGNQADALDVLQETFLYLLGKFPGLRLTASLTTFLYPVVKHLSLNVRRRRSGGQIDEDFLFSLPDPAGPQTSRTELTAALATLPVEQREVILMRFLDDMNLAEIAQALQVPTGTVKSRLHRALDALRHDPRTRDYFLE
jgi:RNA polymerase sigma-70 factor (ECF subfamily)